MTNGYKGLKEGQIVELVARWIVDAADTGRETDLLMLLDTDGSMTYNNKTGFPWEDNDFASRLHPWISRSLAALSEVPGISVRTSSGGKAARTAVVYEGSHLAGKVNADCGYGAEQLTWNEDGTFVSEPHKYSEFVQPLWNLALQKLNEDLNDRYSTLRGRDSATTEPLASYPASTTNWDGRAVWFDLKGTQIAVHERGSQLVDVNNQPLLPDFLESIRESLDNFLKSDDYHQWVKGVAADPNWGPASPNDRAELVKLLATKVEIHPMNAGWELALNLGLHKDTVLVDRLQQTGARRVIKINDDKGDVKGMQKLHELRDAGQVDGLEFAAVYPVDDQGRKTNEEVRALADFELMGQAVPGEASRDFLREPIEAVSAQGRFGIILTKALEVAHSKRPDLVPASAIATLHTPMDQLHTMSPHPRNIGMPSAVLTKPVQAVTL